MGIGQVQEALQLKSSTFTDSQVDAIWVRVMDVGVEATRMPRLSPRTVEGWVILDPENNCAVKQSAVIRQEREATSFLKGRLEHAGDPNDIVLNTTQMRSAKYIQPFCIASPSLDVQLTIFESAKKEVGALKTKTAVKKGKKKKASVTRGQGRAVNTPGPNVTAASLPVKPSTTTQNVHFHPQQTSRTLPPHLPYHHVPPSPYSYSTPPGFSQLAQHSFSLTTIPAN
ncbi:hypothetical protein L218DRAFT_999840 [Marasmius fiardii PR-910]|nr:hypothetical protein L218DRAFT_999840 [Marasmius fiardii PR-910]